MSVVSECHLQEVEEPIFEHGDDDAILEGSGPSLAKGAEGRQCSGKSWIDELANPQKSESFNTIYLDSVREGMSRSQTISTIVWSMRCRKS